VLALALIAAMAGAAVAAARLPGPADGSQWRYTSPRAGSASVAGVEACTRALAGVDIGGRDRSTAELCLRRGGGYPYVASIVLSDPRGHFLCPGCAVRASFDDRDPQSLAATAASVDGSDRALFLRDGPRVAGELKRAAKATFDVTVRGVGRQRVAFDVAGLRWNP
jgi:hypothetical protein